MSSDTIGTLEKYLENGDLPKLPGFQIRTPNVKPQAKPQQLRYINGIPGLYPEVPKEHQQSICVKALAYPGQNYIT